MQPTIDSYLKPRKNIGNGKESGEQSFVKQQNVLVDTKEFELRLAEILKCCWFSKFGPV